MGDFSLNDAIGSALAAWSAREQAKVDARLALSREQLYAYDQTQRSTNPQAMTGTATVPAWLPWVALAGVGLVVWVAVK